MNIRQRLNKLEKLQATDNDLLVLTGPHDADPDEALARWMRETGKPRPNSFVYIRKFFPASETAA